MLMHYQQPFRQMLYKGFPKVVTIKIFVPDKAP